MTCSQILSRAYREIFMIDTDETETEFYGQRYHGVEIDYAILEGAHGDNTFDFDNDFFSNLH